MYPLNTAAPWPFNQWYVAGFSSEVGEGLLGRTFLGRKLILLRDSAGKAHALSGICPHRMMPLELGSLQRDEVVCAYHGLRFGTDGACTAAPTASAKPDCALRSYPLVEAGPLLWIWPGDPALAASTPLPPQAAIGIGAEGWLTQCVAYFQLQARYPLLIDNLFDLSHLGFIHHSLVGDASGLPMIEPRIEERDGRLIVSRDVLDVPVDGYHRFLHPEAGERMSIRMETDLVGISLINAGGPTWNGPGADSPLLGHMNFIHALTPETEHSTHYWTLLTRDFRQDDAGLSAAMDAQNRAVVQQDVDALSAIERVLQSEGDLPREISIKPDMGALRARLRIIQMIRAEQDRLAAAAE
jgi:nitrite reductase/ring-hydroxylating ferredoxin subunit